MHFEDARENTNLFYKYQTGNGKSLVGIQKIPACFSGG